MDTDTQNLRGEWKYFAFAAAITIPALLFRFDAVHGAIPVETLLFGVAILGAAFLLSWAAEVAQLDISQALAIAFLAFIAVLPEYAVDLVFAWKAGRQDRLIHGFEGILHKGQPLVCGDIPCRELAIANMTGANRLLIGLGWAVVVLIWWKKSGERSVVLGEERRTELGFLILATLWAFTIPLRQSLSMIDLVVLGGLFIGYLWHAATAESEEPDLVGPPLALAALQPSRRRGATLVMFLFAAGVILASAEPFADGLVHTGSQLGVNKFLLVQWLAPLASEAPEMIIAILFVLRMKPGAGLGTLVSSKVNQWTLLVATIPLVYAFARGGIHSMTLDNRQVEEVLLTAAQSAFAVATLSNMRISRGEAAGLMALFIAQFGFESTAVRYGFSGLYILLFLILGLARAESRRGMAASVRAALSRPRR
ncbi:MAG: sodium:calcium antiporter [Actinomycetota bacterium]